MLDYATVATCLAVPRSAAWSPVATRLMTFGGLFGLAYSVLTRYELGLIRILPMKAHLALDVVFGAWFLIVASGSRDENLAVRRLALALAGIGFSAPLITRSK